MNDEGITPGAGAVRERTPGGTFDPEVLWSTWATVDPLLALSLGPSLDPRLGRWSRGGDERP
ncbi:hypothetical protein GCM10010495_59050 [Kitasatospora herbaricolor]|uniref:hypothetical protein n=1 Tax=Kitasatospora herbaricolor TaxID=68217 RepID=UPI001748D70A|nr:hypothetical protein [Kitasatospora herbaricolor]MDQ0306660.1 hypothetical protein [Kitasatospora herbaricolor]GGV34253.1 hypothetical protein GCM10010495_59050 [Kitasatospora herbaricolor]